MVQLLDLLSSVILLCTRFPALCDLLPDAPPDWFFCNAPGGPSLWAKRILWQPVALLT